MLLLMNKLRIGYKLVRQLQNKYYSAIETIGMAEYKINEYTKPLFHCGPLAVFESLQDAIRFNNALPRKCKIFECQYLESSASTLWRPIETCIGYDEASMPKGTKLADNVMLTEEISSN